MKKKILIVLIIIVLGLITTECCSEQMADMSNELFLRTRGVMIV